MSTNLLIMTLINCTDHFVVTFLNTIACIYAYVQHTEMSVKCDFISIYSLIDLIDLFKLFPIWHAQK